MSSDTVLATPHHKTPHMHPQGAAPSPHPHSPSDQEAVILNRLGPDIAHSLNDQQKAAIIRAFGGGWQQHPVNLRLSLPWIGGRFFTTVVAGQERRNHTRRSIERAGNPLATVGNLFFVIGLGTIFYMSAIVLLALQSAIIEY